MVEELKPGGLHVDLRKSHTIREAHQTNKFSALSIRFLKLKRTQLLQCSVLHVQISTRMIAFSSQTLAGHEYILVLAEAWLSSTTLSLVTMPVQICSTCLTGAHMKHHEQRLYISTILVSVPESNYNLCGWQIMSTSLTGCLPNSTNAHSPTIPNSNTPACRPAETPCQTVPADPSEPPVFGFRALRSKSGSLPLPGCLGCAAVGPKHCSQPVVAKESNFEPPPSSLTEF